MVGTSAVCDVATGFIDREASSGIYLDWRFRGNEMSSYRSVPQELSCYTQSIGEGWGSKREAQTVASTI